MKNRFILIILILGIPKLLFSIENVNKVLIVNELYENNFFVDTCERCNIVIVKEIDKNIRKLNSTHINKFLATLSDECNNNIEFIEYFNKELFKVLEFYPVQFINSMTSQKNIKIESILFQLSNPLYDINYIKLTEIIRNINTNDQLKFKIIEALNSNKFDE